jgi:hypothetical protein
MNQSKLKLDDSILLTLLLKQCKMTAKAWTAEVSRKYNLHKAELLSSEVVNHPAINPKTEQPYFSEEQIWDTGYHLVKTTKYGRIKDIEMKPRSVVNPKIVVKKKRKF